MMHMNIAPSGCRLTVFFPDGAMVIEMLVMSSSFSAIAPANYGEARLSPRKIVRRIWYKLTSY
jgi:hypothetical protein